MPISATGRFSFVKTYPAWQINEAWRSRIRAMTQQQLEEAATARNAFASAWTNQITGRATLAAQAAAARIQSATTAALQKAAQNVNLTV